MHGKECRYYRNPPALPGGNIDAILATKNHCGGAVLILGYFGVMYPYQSYQSYQSVRMSDFSEHSKYLMSKAIKTGRNDE
jgi:hypothetical protein